MPDCWKSSNAIWNGGVNKMVGSVRFELTTSSSRTRRANQAALRADNGRGNEAGNFPQNQRFVFFIFGYRIDCSRLWATLAV